MAIEGTWSPAVFKNNSFEPSNDLHVRSTGQVLDLTGNWWGNAYGPDPDKFLVHDPWGNVGNNDDSISLEPWLAQPPAQLGPRSH